MLCIQIAVWITQISHVHHKGVTQYRMQCVSAFINDAALFWPQCLKTKDLEDDVHVSFSQLLSELHKESAPYALSIANRLYGEQSYQFAEVCSSAWTAAVYVVDDGAQTGDAESRDDANPDVPDCPQSHGEEKTFDWTEAENVSLVSGFLRKHQEALQGRAGVCGF